jgi:hypothetical protein
MAANEPRQKPQVSDEAVRAATGKGWDEWFSVLDAAGGRELTHQQIVAYLREQHGVGPWWQQGVTNTYEQYIGRRSKHEMPEGFQISRSRTLLARLPELLAAWTDYSVRGAWLLQGDFQVRKATPEKSLRLTWGDGSRVEVSFAAKGEARSTVTVQHSQLPDAVEAERRKAYWTEMLDRLVKYLSHSPLS